MASLASLPRVLVMVAGALAALTTSCGDGPPAKTEQAAPAADTRWTAAFEGTPDLLVTARPHAILRDPVYGPLLRKLSAMATGRSAALRATRALDVLEGSEELICGARTSGPRTGELAIVLRGVRADHDPGKIQGDDQRPIWKLAGEVRDVQEWQAPGASLFVLPSRTWVFVMDAEGAPGARERVRVSLASGERRPVFRYDEDALVSIRVDGPGLVESTSRLRQGASLAALGHHLASMTASLARGDAGAATVAFSYQDEDSAALAEVSLGQVLAAVKRSDRPKVAWLKTTEIERRAPNVVTAKLTLPAWLLKGLAKADGADVEWPEPEK